MTDDSGKVMLSDAEGEATGSALPGAIGATPEGAYDAADGRRRFAQMPVPGTPWRVVMTVPESVLYEPAAGVSRWLPWIVLFALAIAGAVGLRLAARRARAERKLAASEDLHRSTLRHLPDAAVMVFDHDLRFSLADGPALEHVGWSSSEIIGRRFSEFAPPDAPAALEQRLRAALAGETESLEWEASRVDRILDMQICPVRSDGEIVAGLLILRDITERKRLEAELRRLADRDALSGLFNRRRFEADLAAQVARSRRHGERAALLILDVNDFKQVNDRFGHHVGDELIKHIAAMLGERVRDSDSIGRLGGDEFAILLGRVTPDEAAHTAEDIARLLRDRPMVRPDGQDIVVSASVGIAFIDASTVTAEQALVDADVSMYDDKAASRGTISELRQPTGGDSRAVRVFHCEDSESYRRLLAQMLLAHDDIEIVGGAGDPIAALAGVATELPDVILFDASMHRDDLALLGRLRASAPRSRVLVLSGDERLSDSLADEVGGFVSKSRTFDEIADAVRNLGATRRGGSARVAEGGSAAAPRSSRPSRGKRAAAASSVDAGTRATSSTRPGLI